MKWILWLAILLVHSPLLAAEQYSKTQCDSLKQQKEQLRKRLNAGYSFAEGEQLNNEDRELFRLIASHCASPIADTASEDELGIQQDTTQRKRQPPPQYAGVSLQQMPDWSGRNAIFKGDKAAAWAEHYQVPADCRKKQLSEAEFVACADHKALQRQQFEQRWQQLKFTPLTAGTAQSAIAHPKRLPVLESIPAYAVVSTSAAAKLLPSTAVETQPPTRRYVDNIQQQFHWVGLAILALLAIGGWLIWRR